MSNCIECGEPLDSYVDSCYTTCAACGGRCWICGTPMDHWTCWRCEENERERRDYEFPCGQYYDDDEEEE